MSLARDSAWAAAAAIALAGARFTVAAVLARRMPLADFGQYAYGQWLADFVFLVCSLGATGAVARYMAEFRHEPGALAAVIRQWRPYAVGLPIVAAAVVPLAALASGLTLTWEGHALLVLWTWTNGLWAMQTAALSGLQRFDLICAANVTAAVCLVAGALLVPVDVNGPGRVFGLMAVASAVAALVGRRTTRRLAVSTHAGIAPDQWRRMRGYALNMWLTAVLWNTVWSRGEMPVVKAYLGDVDVARYAAALVLFGGAMQAVMLASSGVAPQLTRYWGEGAHTRAVSLARRVMDTQLLLCGVAALVMLSFSPELLHLAFGPAFRSEAGTLAVLSLGLIGVSVSSQSHLLQIATDARFTRNSTLAGLGVLLLSAVVLVSGLGLMGAALARAGTMLALAAVALYFVHVRWGASAYSRGNIAAVMLIATAMAALQPWVGDVGWTLRAGLAGIAIASLAATVRDAEGRNQAQFIFRYLRRAMRPEPAMAGKMNRR